MSVFDAAGSSCISAAAAAGAAEEAAGGGAAAEHPCAPGISPRAPFPSGRVLTDAVLQKQRDTIDAISEVAKYLKEIKRAS